MPIKPITRKIIENAIREHGPMKTLDIMDVTGLTRAQVNGAISYARKTYPGQVFHIFRWARQDECKGGEMAPVYGLGPKKDAKKPPRWTRTELNRRWVERHPVRVRLHDAKRSGSAQPASPFDQLLALAQ